MKKLEFRAKTGLYKVEDLVKEILENIPETRDDDYYLIYEVEKRLEPELLNRTYREYLLSTKTISFKTIERARRKVQSKYPELQASKKVQEARLEYENAYTEYGIEGNHIPRIDYSIGE